MAWYCHRWPAIAYRDLLFHPWPDVAFHGLKLPSMAFYWLPWPAVAVITFNAFAGHKKLHATFSWACHSSSLFHEIASVRLSCSLIAVLHHLTSCQHDWSNHSPSPGNWLSRVQLHVFCIVLARAQTHSIEHLRPDLKRCTQKNSSSWLNRSLWCALCLILWFTLPCLIYC